MNAPTGKELLTHDEHALVRELGSIWGRFCLMVAEGPTRDADLGEIILHVHALQHFVMKQAAARAYPDLYRLAGATVGATARPPQDAA